MLRQATSSTPSRREAESLLLAGRAGEGKSSIMAQVIEKLDEAGVTYLALSMDELDGVISSADLGNRWGLPASPPSCLASRPLEVRPFYASPNWTPSALCRVVTSKGINSSRNCFSRHRALLKNCGSCLRADHSTLSTMTPLGAL